MAEIKVQQSKIDAVKSLKEAFGEANDFIFADFRGINVEKVTELRRKLREGDAELKVVKNNYAKIAFRELDHPEVAEFLVGPTAVAMIKGEAGQAAKTLVEFEGDTPLKLKSGLIGGELYDLEKIVAFSKLPTKKELIQMLLFAIQGTTTKLVRTLQAVADKKAEEGDASVSAAAPAEEAAPAAPSEEAAPAADAEVSAE
ncbi:MAG: 50S ribosomal protein L10 [Spirochaetales bacterium]|nr:50S ribosomal protein L10 [Spirochaetales bacterium]